MFASGNDWWFHAKGPLALMSIVKTNGSELRTVPLRRPPGLRPGIQQTGGNRVEVDYVEKKHVRKVAGAAPVFVIYHTNYSMVIDSNISGITEITPGELKRTGRIRFPEAARLICCAVRPAA